MPAVEEKKDWLPIVGVGLGVGTLFLGLYFYMKKEYPTTDIKAIAISVVGAEWPITDIKAIAISVTGPAYPETDIKAIAISVTGPEYPITDIKAIAISVTGPPYPDTDIKSIEISLAVAAVGFSAELSNLPLGHEGHSDLWWAEFGAEWYSGWLAVDEPWVYPERVGVLPCYFRVLVYSFDYGIVYDKTDEEVVLKDGHRYYWDCYTHTLYDYDTMKPAAQHSYKEVGKW